jgi:DNA-binding MarR family transcriptional regulator
VFLEALQAVAMDRDLGAQELRVLNYMMSKIGFKNDWQSLNQAELGRDLGMHRNHVSRAIKRLVDKGVIMKGVRIGNAARTA